MRKWTNKTKEKKEKEARGNKDVTTRTSLRHTHKPTSQLQGEQAENKEPTHKPHPAPPSPHRYESSSLLTDHHRASTKHELTGGWAADPTDGLPDPPCIHLRRCIPPVANPSTPPITLLSSLITVPFIKAKRIKGIYQGAGVNSRLTYHSIHTCTPPTCSLPCPPAPSASAIPQPAFLPPSYTPPPSISGQDACPSGRLTMKASMSGE